MSCALPLSYATRSRRVCRLKLVRRRSRSVVFERMYEVMSVATAVPASIVRLSASRRLRICLRAVLSRTFMRVVSRMLMALTERLTCSHVSLHVCVFSGSCVSTMNAMVRAIRLLNSRLSYILSSIRLRSEPRLPVITLVWIYTISWSSSCALDGRPKMSCACPECSHVRPSAVGAQIWSILVCVVPPGTLWCEVK